MNLISITSRAIKWSALDAVLRQGLQFLVTIVLARLLAPEDFGVVAMLSFFTALATLFVDGGFSSALIQQKSISIEEESTAFFFNLIVAIVMALGLVMAAAWIADFFAQPVLRPVAYIFALNIVVGSLGLMQRTLLTRDLQFKTLAKVGGVASVFSGILAIALAWMELGLWSLVFQVLLANILSVSLLWHWHPWRPRLIFKLGALKTLFRFGGFLLLSGVLDVCFSQLHGLLIGKLYSARDLGLYVRALNSRQMPLGLLEAIFNRVMFPAFSRAADDKEYLVAGLKRALAVMMFFNIPAMIGLAVIAEPLLEVLFGSNWVPAAPILQMLCLAGVFWPVHTANLNVLMALGRSDLYFRIEIIKKLIGIASVVIACPLGVLAIAGAQLVTSIICIFINTHYTGIFLGYGPVRQLQALLPNLGAGIFLGTILWLVKVRLHLPPAAEVLVLIGLGAAVYIGVFGRILKLKAFEDVVAQFRAFGERTP